MAGREYLDLLTGRMDFILYRRLMPWDHAAGVFLHGEAGGEGRLVDGRDYRPTLREGPILLAPDVSSWQAVKAVLFD
jgi:fructose-1,6-bisphosphatase/inositol monophosphatase family enzyme